MFMNWVGDGPEGQPTEGVSLDGIVGLMGDEPGEAPDESAEDADESEIVEELEAGEQDDESEVPEAEDDSEDDAEEATFTVKHDGKDVTLKQSELIDMAQKGFDYTRKTMAVAEERKALEPLRQQAEQARAQADEHLKTMTTQADALVTFLRAQVGDPPPIELAQRDAGQFIAQKTLHENRLGQLQQAIQHAESLHIEAARKRQADIDARAEATLKVLADTLPGWDDSKRDGLFAYLSGAGLTIQRHADALVESGLWTLAHKAQQFDALMAEKAKLKPVQKTPPKVHKPGGNNQPPQLARHQRQQEAMKAHDARPSLNSLAALLD